MNQYIVTNPGKFIRTMHWSYGVFILIGLTALGKLISYNFTGPDFGTTTFVHSDHGEHFIFFGVGSTTDQTTMIDRITQLIYRKDVTNQTGGNLDYREDSLLSPYYLDTSHPCNSFYDSVCGLLDSVGTGNAIEDANLASTMDPSFRRSSGMFHDVTEFSQSVFMNVVNQNVYYKTCVLEGSLAWLDWPNIQIPDLNLANSRVRGSTNVTAIGLFVLSKLISKGIQTPIDVKIEKIFHEPVFGVGVLFNMLPILDLTFHNNPIYGDDTMDSGRPMSMFQFYDMATTLNPNITTSPETVAEYIHQCSNITNLQSLTVELFRLIFPNLTKVNYICTFGELDTIVSLLVQLIGNEPTTYWDYFHRLSLYYEALPYLGDRDGIIHSKTVPISRLDKKDWLLLLFQNVRVCQ